MPWFDKFKLENVKKNVCIYLLQRHLGQYFEKQISRDQLKVDITNGSGIVQNIGLDVQAVNDVCEKFKLPLELVEGFIGKLHLEVPWKTLSKDSCYIKIEGLKLTLQPKQRSEYATSLIESMYNSMSSSVQLAEDFARCEQNFDDATQTYEGQQIFVQAIDSVLRKVKIDFVDTVIQMEYVPKNSTIGVGITINIDLVKYSDEAASDPVKDESASQAEGMDLGYMVQAFTTKKLSVQNVTFSTVEFSVTNTGSYAYPYMMESCHQGEAALNDSQDEIFYALDENPDLTPQPEPASDKSCPDTYRHTVVFGKLNSEQQIQICMKQPDTLEGPKVSFDINLGSLILFLSPRQIYLLSELCSGLANLDYDDSRVLPKQKLREKQMTASDYQKVERVLQEEIQPPYGMSGMQHHGWSSGCNDESDTEDTFLPLNNTMSAMYDSTFSAASSSMESSVTSAMTGSASGPSLTFQRRINHIETDPTAEISHFQIRLASLALVLLHEDIMTLSADNPLLLISSNVQQMQAVSESFFQNVGDYVLSAHNGKDFTVARTVFEKACQRNHLRLLAAPVQIEAKEKTTSSNFSITGHLTAAKMEFLECLYDENKKVPEYVPLLVFTHTTPSQPTPAFKMDFKHVEKTTRHRSPHRTQGPKTVIVMNLGKCNMELDLTMLDRITTFNPQKICIGDKSPNSSCGIAPTPDSTLELKVNSSLINIKLRFPIPDFRPAHDMNKVPWWKRNVRPDYLVLSLNEAKFSTEMVSSQTLLDYKLYVKTLEVYYHETESCVPLLIGKTGLNEVLDPLNEYHQDVLLRLRIETEIQRDIIEEICADIIKPEVDPMIQSVYGAFECQLSKDPEPFSSKKVLHASDTPHSDSKEKPEEIVMPADKEEMCDFVRTAMSTAMFKVNVYLPAVVLQLPSKHIYELLYNRINNDLLLWEPSAPKPQPHTFDNISSAFGNMNINRTEETFLECKSGAQYESESDTEEDVSEDLPPAKPHNRSTYVAVCIQINSGMVNLMTPCRDSANRVIPERNGDFMLTINDGRIGIASGYLGDNDLTYVSVEMQGGNLYHCDMMSSPTRHVFRDFLCVPPRHLKCTIQKSDPEVLTECKDRGNQRGMLSVAVRVQASHETHHVKTARVALGINKATLNHRMCNEPNTWMSHILDFFNVQDYPIAGYNAKDVLTEFHLHMWDCAIDYRPLYLPLRAVATIGAFSMSSQLSAQGNTSTLRFIFEECDLYITDKGPPKDGKPSNLVANLRKDYINVIELGIFELSIKTTDKVSKSKEKSGLNPHFDLRASNNILHIRTCADSGRALMQLITYYASDGDLVQSEEASNCSSTYSSPRHQYEEDLITVDPDDVNSLSKSQHQHITNLIGEAMEETISVEDTKQGSPQQDAKMFFFPDEKHTYQDACKPLPLVTHELGDVAHQTQTKQSDTDDEFTFVENEGGPGRFPKDGEITIKWHTTEPVKIIDNYFYKPDKRTDLLDTPDIYPTPSAKYRLCEMTIVWHMYGGNDFAKAPASKKSVNIVESYQDSVSFQNNKSETVTFKAASPAGSRGPWKYKGGSGRDHKVLMELQLNKVRFVHETFPDGGFYTSRQVLLIHEVEIRDRLAASNINKFLYLFTNQEYPKQTNANMVHIRMAHIRPDKGLPAQECGIKISLLPLRLNIDQDSLLFLINFFSALSGSTPKEEQDGPSTSKHNTPTHQPPIISVGSSDEEQSKESAKKLVDENLMLLMEESDSEKTEELVEHSSSTHTEKRPIYFRKVQFTPDVPIQIDYQAKRLDMTHGPIAGLFLGLAQLNCSRITLKSVEDRRGLLGVDKLLTFLLREWLNHVKRSQLPGILGGVGPLHAIMQLFQGIKDLFWLPIEQYQKDGRFVRGLQRGANSFTTSTAVAALELTSRLIYLIQITAETAYDMLSPGPSVKKQVKHKGRKKRYNQPQDIREGVAKAYHVVRDGFGETATNIAQVASHQHEQKGYSGALGGLVRELPSTMIKPIIIASEATGNVLGGMRSQLVPDARTEANQKWRSDDT